MSNVNSNPSSAAIVRAVIGLGRGLGLPVLAEGVETKEQLEHLRAIGATIVQGYYFAKPMPPEALTEMLSRSMFLEGGAPPAPPVKARAGRRRVA